MLPLTEIQCPYCGETIALAVDDSAGEQHYIEDCQVCCRPMVVVLSFDDEGALALSVRGENDA